MIPEFSEPEEEIDEVCKNNSGSKSHCLLLCANYLPDIVLNVLLSSDSHLDPIKIDRYYHYPHFQVKKLGLVTEK